jgi:gas vesicle protein
MSKLLLGFAAGVVVGLLFAPEKGSDIRQKIADSATDLKEKFEDFIDSLGSKVDDLATEADKMANQANKSF